MTFLEKFKEELPNYPLNGSGGTPRACPHMCRYEQEYDCAGVSCEQCWNREMPETNNINISKGETKMEGTTRKTKKELLEEIAELKKQAERAGRYEQYDEAAAEIKAMTDSFINAGFDEGAAFTLVLKMVESAGKVGR